MATGKEFLNPMNPEVNPEVGFSDPPPAYHVPAQPPQAVSPPYHVPAQPVQVSPQAQPPVPVVVNMSHVGAPAPTPVTQTNVVVNAGRGDCPICRVGKLKGHFPCCAICCCILLFPIGILCCLCMRKKKCGSCGYVI